MTDEEAVKWLERLEQDIQRLWNMPQHKEALQRGIKALNNMIWLRKQLYGEVKDDDR